MKMKIMINCVEKTDGKFLRKVDNRKVGRKQGKDKREGKTKRRKVSYLACPFAGTYAYH